MERAADELLAYLERRGYAAYQVGGCVRDRLFGYPIQDIDVATSATPEEILALFPRAIPTGIKHGTVTVLWNEYAFEVTTFRVDGAYRDYRQPTEVEFVDQIELDLARRDFTINAMAMDRRGKLIDPFQGKEDLKRRLLRAVGEPRRRFAEDALRILRAIRFSARFQLAVEERTWEALLHSAPLLAAISKERIRDELVKMMNGENPMSALKLLSTPNFLPFPDLSALFCSPIIGRMPRGFERLSERARWVGLWLLADWNTERTADFLRRWKFSNRESRDKLRLLTLTRQINTVEDDAQAKRLLLKYGLEHVLEALRIHRWARAIDDTKRDAIRWRKLDTAIQIRDLRQLAIDGQALLAAFERKPGPWVGTVLHTLFEQVALDGLPNEREHLLEAARKVLREIEGTHTEHL